jgi:hypothetical protein
LLEIYLKRSAFTHINTQYFDKFDTILGQVFGLLGFVGLFIFGVYQGYNGWCFSRIFAKILVYLFKNPA